MKLTNRVSANNPKQKMEIFAVVSGSFNRFLPQIQEVIREMFTKGIEVLSPNVGKPISKIRGFIMLENDKGLPAEIERNHLEAIGKSDFLYVVTPKGYIGESVAFEIGYAISKGIPIYCSESPKGQIFKSFMISDMPLISIKKLIATKKKKMGRPPLKGSSTLADLQNYVAEIAKIRGFSKENLVDVALLLIEEVGELAKAIRLKTGIKLAQDSLKGSRSIGSELADCLIYLLDLANLSNVKLQDALLLKEAYNSKRKWVKVRQE